ncbi:MAG: ribosome silencing factor [Planctomycetes bacterium]|nr:ribosome silencing factor [Planctomycetota bacterium]
MSSKSQAPVAKKAEAPLNVSRSQSQGDAKDIRQFAIELARMASELKCEQVTLIDVRGRSQLCEYLVIASGTSDRQMKAVADQLKAYGAEHGMPRWKRDRDTNGTWIAADFVDVVVHLFEPGQRAWYDLEGMWVDAPRVEWRKKTIEKSEPAQAAPVAKAPAVKKAAAKSKAAKVVKAKATKAKARATAKSAKKSKNKTSSK